MYLKKKFRGLDMCLQNFDVETFRYRSLGRQKLCLADNIKICHMEVGFFLWMGKEWNYI
jgi:hypothetical protein